MADQEQTRTKDVNVPAAGSYADELKPQIAEEGLGDGAADEPLRQGTNGEKEPTQARGTNPKRTENSRPD